MTNSKPEIIQDESQPERPAKGVAAVDRALSILLTLESTSAPLTLSELSRQTGLYKSTVLRLIESLQIAGYIFRTQDTRYTLGPTVYRLGIAYEQRNPLRNLIPPILQQLVDAGTESPSFYVRQGNNKRLCLFRLDSSHSTLDHIRVGDLLPLERGAAGCILLAFEGASGERFDAARRDLWALSIGERDANCAGIAAPVFGSDDQLIGALSLSGPRERFNNRRIKWMREQVVAAARSLTLSLGGDFPPPERSGKRSRPQSNRAQYM